LAGNLGLIGGKAVYDEYDPQKKTVILLPPSKTADIYKPGDTVEVTVAGTVEDPAGNAMDTANNKASGIAS